MQQCTALGIGKLYFVRNLQVESLWEPILGGSLDQTTSMCPPDPEVLSYVTKVKTVYNHQSTDHFGDDKKS